MSPSPDSPPRPLTVLADDTRQVEGEIIDGRVLVGSLPDAVGWTRRPEGLCRGDVCVPVGDDVTLEDGDRIDLVAVAELLDRPVLVDEDAGVVALGGARHERRSYLAGGEAPNVQLRTLDGTTTEIAEFGDRPTVLVTFASWCGCRYDLPGWQTLQDELGPDAVNIVGIALDQDPASVRPFTEEITFPVLYDPDHAMADRYAVSNVPTVIWIEAGGRVARPNTVAFGTDDFVEFHGVPSGPHLDAIRRWVATGEATDPADESAEPTVADLTEDELRARLWFRIAAHLHRAGDEPAAAERFARAATLAPLDFTISRAAMPLTGRDPFGDEFLELYARWDEAGRPAHALAPDRGPVADDGPGAP